MNADELFGADECVSLSPKLRWLSENNLETQECDGLHWVCRVKKDDPERQVFADREIASGDTEQDAIANYCLKNAVKMWFEI